LRELVQTSAAAIKDLQQAETDSVTAQVEKQRAHLRLRQIGVDPEKPSQSGTVTIAAPTSGSAHRLVRYALKPDPDKVMKLSRATWPTCHAIAGHIVGKCAPTRSPGQT
jgi:hypothetical protein